MHRFTYALIIDWSLWKIIFFLLPGSMTFTPATSQRLFLISRWLLTIPLTVLAWKKQSRSWKRHISKLRLTAPTAGLSTTSKSSRPATVSSLLRGTASNSRVPQTTDVLDSRAILSIWQHQSAPSPTFSWGLTKGGCTTTESFLSSATVATLPALMTLERSQSSNYFLSLNFSSGNWFGQRNIFIYLFSLVFSYSVHPGFRINLCYQNFCFITLNFCWPIYDLLNFLYMVKCQRKWILYFRNFTCPRRNT